MSLIQLLLLSSSRRIRGFSFQSSSARQPLLVIHSVFPLMVNFHEHGDPMLRQNLDLGDWQGQQTQAGRRYNIFKFELWIVLLFLQILSEDPLVLVNQRHLMLNFGITRPDYRGQVGLGGRTLLVGLRFRKNQDFALAFHDYSEFSVKPYETSKPIGFYGEDFKTVQFFVDPQVIFGIVLNLIILNHQMLADRVEYFFANPHHLRVVLLYYSRVLPQDMQAVKKFANILGTLNHLHDFCFLGFVPWGGFLPRLAPVQAHNPLDQEKVVLNAISLVIQHRFGMGLDDLRLGQQQACLLLADG